MADSSYKRLFESFPGISTESWEAVIKKDLKGQAYTKKLIWKTLDSLEIQPYYRQEDLSPLCHLDALPGNYPFVRGNNRTVNKWEIRQDIWVKDIKKANEIAQRALKRGATALAFGIHAGSEGIYGIPVHQLSDMETLLKDIDLTQTPITLLGGLACIPLLAQVFSVAKKQAIPLSGLRVQLGWDPITSRIQPGGFVAYYTEAMLHESVYSGLQRTPSFPPIQQEMEQLDALISVLDTYQSPIRPICVNGEFYHECGASTTQELSYSLATANEYLVSLTDAGKSVDDIAPRIQFSLATGSSYFIEIAKFRALRMLWAQVVKAYHPQSEKTMETQIHGVSSHWNKTLYDTHVNMLRTTTESMAAIVGGCDSVSVRPFHDILHVNDELGERMARNIQLVLKNESYLDKVIDPAGGSYYIENLTDIVAKEAWKQFQELEQQGGMIQAIKRGFVHQHIQTVSEQRQENVKTRKELILGTNQYPNPKDRLLSLVEKSHISLTPYLKTNHDVSSTDSNWFEGVCSDANLGMTVGTYMDHVFKKDSAEEPYRMLQPYRGAQIFEELRLETERFEREKGKVPRVYLLTMGNLTMRKARASFSGNFFGCAGYEIMEGKAVKTPAEGIKEAIEKKADVVVLCSSDEEYSAMALGVQEALASVEYKPIIVVAGNPTDQLDTLKEAGVEHFIHIKSNLYQTLHAFNEQLLYC